ncbi:MAG TPA: MFS transporter [Stellaceae bacterium]|nr:MFS transporter [Stellaceae bacterium]
MATATAFALLDEQPLKRFHLRAMFTTGMGVFTDGYDLASIGVVLPLVLASFGVAHVSGLQSGMLAASALVGAALGALIFGVLAQRGRKTFYGLDVTLMAVAAVAQIFATDLWSLITIRFVLGIGVGADYVLSPTIMAEHANRGDRGKTLGIGFGVMWWAGAVAAGLLLLVLKAAGVSPDMQWRIVLAAGAVPALSVLYLRRRMPETARYLARLAGDPGAAADVVEEVSGKRAAMPEADRREFWQVLNQYMGPILASAVLWMLFDIVVYSGILFGPSLIAQGLGVPPAIFSLVMSLVFIIPTALILSLFALDRLGRKPTQAIGMIMAAVMLTIFALYQDQLKSAPLLGLLVYGLYSVFITFPSMVSGAGILGVELAPTRVRTVAQSISVVGGRIGASLSAFLFPLLFSSIGEVGVIGLLAGAAVLGGVLTLIIIPETRGRSLEEINEESAVPAAAGYAAQAGVAD